MKRICLYILSTLVLASCGRSECSSYMGDNSQIHASLSKDIILPTTPVKDQGATDLCWIYAMLATIETDRLAQGDSVHLSPQWLARKSLEEQAVATYLKGTEISLRGTLPEAMRLLETYGIVAWDAYPSTSGAASHAEARRIDRMARIFANNSKGIESLQETVESSLDDSLGPTPRNVFMLGMEYTPLEFAHSLCLPGDWRAYTSFTHHPFHRPFAVEVPDNRQGHEAMNVPIGELLRMSIESLKHGHPVAWEGCMTFMDDNGKGKGNSRNVTPNDTASLQKKRQRLFESHRLTDDHAMAIIGMGHTKDGQRLFILKNSWGEDFGNKGFAVMTERQFALYTIMIMLRK